MDRRRLLQSMASVGIGASLLGVTTAEPSVGNLPQEEYNSLKEKYGENEAQIISQRIGEGKSIVEILYHPDLTEAREDYLDYEYSKAPAHREIDDRLLDVASRESISRAKNVGLTDSNWDFDAPCAYSQSVSSNGLERNASPEITFNNFYFQQANKTSYNGASCSYRSTCFYSMADKLNASATAGIYGSAYVYLRHVSGGFGEGLTGTYNVVGEFDVKGDAVDGTATLSILKYDSSTGVIETHEVEEITAPINQTVNGQTTLDFSSGDRVGVELTASASTAGGGAYADIKEDGKGANPTVKIYKI
jgi:hypothetical protein